VLATVPEGQTLNEKVEVEMIWLADGAEVHIFELEIYAIDRPRSTWHRLPKRTGFYRIRRGATVVRQP